MSKTLNALREELAEFDNEYIPGKFVIVAIPVYDGRPDTVNADGVTVGDDFEWRRIPWANILGTADPTPAINDGESDETTL